MIVVLVPGIACAEVCDKERPDWDGDQVTALSEAMTLFATPFGLLLLAFTVLALRFRHQWMGLAAVLGWTAFITLITMADPTGLRADAMVEGCIGSPTLFIVAVAAICIGTVFYTMPHKADE
ncbi:hypothetical protein ACERZ8_07945 [Tateyamaria armeniaca]|uniref:Uncharacterized protein n=1 Tax=Tateyamaria armeniaca TaxID=2518930 RepID=A0ABW8URQ2_9RHOB